MTTQLERRPGQDYTPEEIDRGLTAIALASGNTRRAAQHLANTDLPIPRDTLKHWVHTRKQRYLEVQRQVLPELRARMAEENESLAIGYVHAEHRATGLLMERLAAAEEAQWTCSVSTCSYVAKTRENFQCPDHPDAAPNAFGHIDARDLSQIAKNVSIPKGIAVEKSLLLRGDPTQITQHRGLEEITKGLNRLGVMAEDVRDAELVEEIPTPSRPSPGPRTPASNARA